MSDLINRKKIRDYIKGEINPYGKPFEGTAYELGWKIMRYIDAMDSAYSVDKVVEELEEKINDDSCDGIGTIWGTDAIEIVKHGGVSDNVCEYRRQLEGYNSLFITSCCHLYRVGNDFKFCPHCGKKIKVVE